MASPAALRFANGPPNKRQFGERLRLVIKEGSPVCFCLLGSQVTLGRDAICDIQLEDSKISRRHVEFTWKVNQYHAKDLGSQNGFIHNGQRVTQATIAAGDTLLVGATLLEAQTADGAIPRIETKAAPAAPKPQDNVAKNRLIVGAGIVVIILLIFSGTEGRIKTFRERARIDLSPEEGPKKAGKKESKDALSDVIPNYLADAKNPDSEVFFRAGVRELQNKNFRRALTNFDTALSVDPNHDLAKVYKELTKREFDKEVQLQLSAAVQARKSGRIREARMHYETAMNYLQGDRDNPKFVETELALEALGRLERGEQLERDTR